MKEIKDIYTNLGGKFVTSITEIEEKLKNIKAFLFDWDGVFNNGLKEKESSSGFHEQDVQGLSLLRFGLWLKNNHQFAQFGIISKSDNETALYLSQLEHFNHLFIKYKHKANAIKLFCEKTGIQPSEIAYFYDDVYDFSAVRLCGLKVLVRRTASPLLENYAIQHGYCDYVTGHEGGAYALREVSELFLALSGQFDSVVYNRMMFNKDYQDYISQRNMIALELVRG